MTEAVSKFVQGMGAITMGQIIGYSSEGITRRIRKQKKLLTADENAEDTIFDDFLEILVQCSFIVLGVSLVEKAMPSITRDLHALLFFEIGLFHSTDDLTANMKSLYNVFMNE